MTVAIESAFPSAQINGIAEQESWRKEINRPTYHLHKWWATRLGSVFRAILIGALAPDGADIGRLFYERVAFPDAVVLDPMMGSGTTIGEALKLGCRVIGQDINPVSYIQVRKAIERCNVNALADAYARLEQTIGPRIRALYQVQDPEDPAQMADSLYGFHVMAVACPRCTTDVQLFDSYIFARHAYTKRFPTVRSICPVCGEINSHHGGDSVVTCHGTSPGLHTYDPHAAPAAGTHALCATCGERFKILDSIKAGGGPPRYVLYASLVRTASGKKVYLRARPGDADGLQVAGELLAHSGLGYPHGLIAPGHNTDQLRSHGYRQWSELFTSRQLYSLALLAHAIATEPDTGARGLLALLLSGTVEYNNLLCSYKGEGTGAVRPTFSHHILKPERMSLENAVWGLPESSGCFSTLYKSRVLPALAYRQRPFEVRVVRGHDGKTQGEKVYGVASSMTVPLAATWDDLVTGRGRALLRCGDSRHLPIPDGSVDAVVTDPPYFDFVHYSELADLFHGWLHLALGGEYPMPAGMTTRQAGEVQQRDPQRFAAAMTQVFAECQRVLKPDGVLVFSFHHSRTDGWAAIGQAVLNAGLMVAAAHPVKAEMSVATPKAAASEAIDIDAILVCKRRTRSVPAMLDEAVHAITASAATTAATYQASVKRPLTRGDLLVIQQSQALRVASQHIGTLVDGNGHAVGLDALLAASSRRLDELVHGVLQVSAAG